MGIIYPQGRNGYIILIYTSIYTIQCQAAENSQTYVVENVDNNSKKHRAHDDDGRLEAECELARDRVRLDCELTRRHQDEAKWRSGCNAAFTLIQHTLCSLGHHQKRYYWNQVSSLTHKEQNTEGIWKLNNNTPLIEIKLS